MRQSLNDYMQRRKAERLLFTARQTLTHLVEIYNSGQWRRLYGEEAFICAVRKAREAVDHWTNVLGQLGGGSARRSGVPPGRSKAPSSARNNAPSAAPVVTAPAGTKVTRVC